MKAKITYDLNDHDDFQAMERNIKSTDMALVLWEIRHNMQKEARSRFEIGKESDNLPDGVFDELDMFYHLLYDELEERGINIDKLIS